MPKSQASRKWLTAAVKVAIVLVVLAFVWDTIAEAVTELGQYSWDFSPWWLILAGMLYLVGLLPAGLYWRHVLLVFGQDARLGEVLRAYYVGHLGKYVPGKAMVVVIRTGLVRSHRVDTAVAAVSVFLETLTMMAVGACIAAGILAVRLRDERFLFWGSLGLMLAAGLPTLPPIFRRLVSLAGVGRSDPATGEKLGRLGHKTLVVGWAAMTLVWVILGLSLWATLRAMGIEEPDLLGHLPRYTACVSLAMVAGFLSLIPGGLGVRDFLLVKLILRLFEVTAAQAAVASGLLRLIWLVSELAISGILYGSRAWISRSGSPDS